MSALGRAVGNIGTCKHLKMQAKVGRLKHGRKGQLQQGNALKYPKRDTRRQPMQLKKTKKAMGSEDQMLIKVYLS